MMWQESEGAQRPETAKPQGMWQIATVYECKRQSEEKKKKGKNWRCRDVKGGKGECGDVVFWVLPPCFLRLTPFCRRSDPGTRVVASWPARLCPKKEVGQATANTVEEREGAKN